MMQLALMPEPPEPGGRFEMRPYQAEAIEAVHKELGENRATMVHMATGLGKTVIFSDLIRQWPGRCLVIAHRYELIQQAARALKRATGKRPQIEQADSLAHPRGDDHVVASIQTLSRAHRHQRFAADAFDLLVIDEVHHGVAPTYRRVIDYFSAAKVLGLTATPDRADEQALGQIIDSVAYQYDLTDAIKDGWLAAVKIRAVQVEEMDFSRLRTVAGDFNQGELDSLMAQEKNLHAVARPTVECSGDRKTIIFTTSVANAHRLAEIIDRYAGKGSAVAVDGSMQRDERREALREFGSGGHQFLVNVGIATEGYDEPATACIVMGRPTKSRALYAQMIGRGTRGGPNCPVDGKTDCLVLDFVGNAGKHDIVTAADVLGGNYSDEEIKEAKQKIESSDEPVDFEEAMRKAAEKRAKLIEKLEREEAARQRRKDIRGEITYSVDEVDPYVHYGVRRDHLYARYGRNPATEKQVAALKRIFGSDLPNDVSKHEASRLLKRVAQRREQGLATPRQVRLLMKFGYDARGWSFADCSRAIDTIAANGWREPG